MFRQDEDYVKRTIIVALAVLLFFGAFFLMIVRVHESDSLTRRNHNEACATIKNEQTRRDCLVGPKDGKVYPK